MSDGVNSRSSYRPLLPATTGGSAGGHSGRGPGPPPRVTSLPKKRQAVSIACDACRSRKIKCDGQQTCFTCRKNQIECTYKTLRASPSTQELQRKYAESENKVKNFEAFITLLRSHKEKEAMEICKRVRSGVDVETILSLVQDGDLLVQMHLHPETQFQYTFPYIRHMPAFLCQPDNVYLNSPLYRSTRTEQRTDTTNGTTSNDLGVQYFIPHHAAELVDPRFGSVKLSEWTAVTRDNAFLTHLLKIYFQFEFPFFPFFHKDYFLEDLIAGCEECCSSLLVNAILAAACHGYRNVENRAEFWDPSTMGYRFLAECRRLWELEIGNSSLTNIQAATILSLTYNMNGLDKVGWTYMIQAIAAAESIDLFGDVPDSDSQKIKVVKTFTAWGLYGFQAFSCFHLFKPPVVRHAPQAILPDPATHAKWYGELWLSYPTDQRLLPMWHGYTFKATAEFRVIFNDMAWQAFAEGRKGLSRKEQVHFQERLNTWYNNLPRQLSANEVLLPSHLKMHALIFILDPLSSSADESSQDQTLSAATVLALAKIKLETLVRLYYVHHGFDSHDVFMMQFLMFLGFMHIRSIATSPAGELNDAYRSTIYLVAKGLRTQGQNYYLAEVIYRMMRDAMSSSDQKFLGTILDVSVDDDVRKSLISRHTRSALPIDIFSINEDPEKQRLSNLINVTVETT
ncbi:C6 transcription factor, putative [Beauveria bassiana ARSEF 2860]|uniref:C6 transcription factor, putative n=1 Tax=Beauveria bassiana (strain ARSEF 2860) TaxID=655819 RepID=J5JMD5_BEAB2|nr:C6 transcription factor, putative [Beauveria bassiana ARSEF 2860]EJP66453.1 C6 transcription factor, putative [Beauveria bassiana ARSEF 2860]